MCMKDRVLDDSPNPTASEISQRLVNGVDMNERRNDWTNSDWLSDWLKLARERNNKN